ncbi:glutaredoxin domain-containing protein [Halioglobus maricola]|uniref:glutaredoxin domain-containing protein n=1 Tax=Halioglobus maricola TaxID=2601894 RepID=UPI0023F5904F|nr:glutaredoxin domain-containing protein [Halioglobus maricola]
MVIFALEWCEFCWSVRKMLSKLGVSCRIIDLDSVAFQENDFGGDIRAALQEKVGSSTIPQIFVRGEYLGGATETFDAFNKGRLQRLFEQQDIEFDTKAQFNAYSFLPKWLHPREAS